MWDFGGCFSKQHSHINLWTYKKEFTTFEVTKVEWTTRSRFRRKIVACVQVWVSGVRMLRPARMSSWVGRDGPEFGPPTPKPILLLRRITHYIGEVAHFWVPRWSPRKVWCLCDIWYLSDVRVPSYGSVSDLSAWSGAKFNEIWPKIPRGSPKSIRSRPRESSRGSTKVPPHTLHTSKFA